MMPENVAAWCKERFGMGDRPDWTQQLYDRLQREAIAFGARVTCIIEQTADYVEMARNRSTMSHLFRKVVRLRLFQAGFMRDQAEVRASLEKVHNNVRDHYASSCAMPKEPRR